MPKGATAAAGWVEFFEGAFVFAAKEPRTGNTLRALLQEMLDEQPIEVIGNLNENPELIEPEGEQ